MNSKPCTIWTIDWGLCSVIEGSLNFLISPKLSEGLFAGFSLTVNFCAIWWGFTSSRYSWRSPILSPGWSFTPLSSGGFLQYLDCPKRIPVLSGLQNPQRDCSAPERYVMGSLLYAFLYCCSPTKKVYWDLFPALRRAYFGGCLSSSLCRGGEN